MLRLTAQELASHTHTPLRTIQYWIERRLLPTATHFPGYGRAYTRDHVQRIAAIKELRDANMTVADMVDRFNPIDDDDESPD